MTTLDNLIKNLSKLPGLGRKSAGRIAYYFLKADSSYVETLAEQMRNLKQRIKLCPICGNYTETIPCDICTDPGRERSTICVVENPQDILTIESAGIYKGLYHVLFGVIAPLNGVGPGDLKIGKLMERIAKDNSKEVIIATNPTVEGDTTALYLVDLLKNRNIRVSRLASGLPAGGDIEYVDRLTLSRSLEGRITLGGQA